MKEAMELLGYLGAFLAGLASIIEILKSNKKEQPKRYRKRPSKRNRR
jgi:hypothetical protein|nr:MAG TPA: hypothetical protein [Caudoviricetes sp.]DAY44887.1 MAG TPA: hypothetical protein [Caudoviricetes sp.]